MKLSTTGILLRFPQSSRHINIRMSQERRKGSRDKIVKKHSSSYFFTLQSSSPHKLDYTVSYNELISKWIQESHILY